MNERQQEIVKKIQEDRAKTVTGRDLSKQLKAAGADQRGTQDSLVWVDDEERGVVVLPAHIGMVCENSGTGKILCRAFDCHELLERLPGGTALVKYTESELVISPYYLAEIHKLGVSRTDMYAAEALGKLYLWCLENGHCDE